MIVDKHTLGTPAGYDSVGASARAFLAAGKPRVISTSSCDLSCHMHKHMDEGSCRRCGMLALLEGRSMQHSSDEKDGCWCLWLQNLSCRQLHTCLQQCNSTGGFGSCAGPDTAAGPVAHHVSPVANIVPAGPSSTAEWNQMQLRLHVVAFSGRGQGMSCCQGPPVATAVAQPSAVPEPGSGPCGSDSAVKKASWKPYVYV
jgi:hypothetical protein